MAGLLDGGYSPDPLAMGLLGMGGALLTPRQLGGGIGPAMQQFSQQAMQAQMMRRQMAQDAMRQRMIDSQIAENDSQIADRRAKRQQDEAIQGAARNAYTPSVPGVGGENNPYVPAAPTPGGFDQQKFIDLLRTIAPLKAMELDQSLRKSPLESFAKIDPKDYTQDSIAAFLRAGGSNPALLVPARKREFVDGVAVDAYNAVPGTSVRNPDKLAQENIIPDGKGGYMVNPLAVQAKKEIARAGATNIGLPKIEVKMGDSVGGQVGPMLAASATAVGGAVKMADAAERILGAIDQGGVIAGPTASLRLKGAQVASMLGIGGKDAVAQPRQVIRGLAESSVEARKELAGQGQVTENEAKAVDKALSGNIDDLTVEEIRDIARLNLRHAAGRARQHQQYLSSMPESLAPARPFYTVPGMDRLLQMDPSRYEIRKPPPSSVQPDGRTVRGTIGQPSIDDLVKKHGGR